MNANYIGQLGAIAVRGHLGGPRGDTRQIARHVGAEWAIPAVEKAAVEANEAALAVDSGTGVQLTAAIDQMRSRSLLLQCQLRGSPDFGLRTGLLQLDEVSPTGVVTDENAPVAFLARVPYGMVSVSPEKVIFQTPLTLELARSEFAAAAIQKRAEDGISRGLDAALLSLAAGLDSTGDLTAGADALSDVRDLVGLVNVTGAQPLILGLAPDVALRAATLRQGGVLCFPGASAVGISEIAGLPALATDRVTAGSAVVLDPSGLAIHVDAIEVGASQNGAILMSTTPSDPGQLTSAFQTGMIVVSVTARFSIAAIRQSDVAGQMLSIAWANS